MSILSRLPVATGGGRRLVGLNNIITKRWSGHNNMDIEPSNYGWKYFKDSLHFYTLISVVPLAVVATIINIRANPVLSEVPEGYEPRHWEYYRHPVTRFIARYVHIPMEMEHEMRLSSMEAVSQMRIIKRLKMQVEQTMKFYNDHRSIYFRPWFADRYRVARDEHMIGEPFMRSAEGHFYDYAYDPKINPIPTEGYRDGYGPPPTK